MCQNKQHSFSKLSAHIVSKLTYSHKQTTPQSHQFSNAANKHVQLKLKRTTHETCKQATDGHSDVSHKPTKARDDASICRQQPAPLQRVDHPAPSRKQGCTNLTLHCHAEYYTLHGSTFNRWTPPIVLLLGSHRRRRRRLINTAIYSYCHSSIAADAATTATTAATTTAATITTPTATDTAAAATNDHMFSPKTSNCHGRRASNFCKRSRGVRANICKTNMYRFALEKSSCHTCIGSIRANMQKRLFSASHALCEL